MERNGDVVAELNNCNPPNCALIINAFSCGKYKMCKDDFVTPLFHSASNHVGNGLVMDSRNLSSESFLSTSDNSIGVKFFSARKNCVTNNQRGNSPTESSTNCLKNNYSVPTWEKPPQLQSFSPNLQKVVEKLHIEDSYINDKNLQLTQNKSPVTEGGSTLGTQNSSGPISNSADVIDVKLLLDYEAETSSSSFEDLLDKNCKSSKNKPVITSAIEIDSIDAKSIQSQSQPHQAENLNLSSVSNHSITKDSISDVETGLYSPTKSDRLMPQLLPTLICLDNENSTTLEKKQEKYEVIDVADSPEMPILIPFTFETDEAFHIKTEIISDSESRYLDSDSRDSADEIRQPKVLLKRIAFNHSSFPKEEKSSIFLSSPVKREIGKSVIEGPEIEEIEGVRFFQFRSKQEMDEFNRKPKKIEVDLDMIVPTKTMDITQIKGWRDKYFAPDAQFVQDSYHFEITKTDDSSHDSKVANEPAEVGKNENQTSVNQKEHANEPAKLESNNSSLQQNSDCTEVKPNDTGCPVSNDNDCKLDIKKIKTEKTEIMSPKTEKTEIMSPKSAFVSEELDKYLSDSSKLNVSFLTRVNPNIIPIAFDAPILSIGKLKKTDAHSSRANLFFKRKREVVIFEKENDTSESIITLADSPESPSVITLSSEESSTEDDVPVATLRSKRTPLPKKENLPNKSVKRRNLNKELDQVSKRVVLRLRKDGDGVSKGYKVSDISCRSEKLDSSSSSSSDISFDSVVMPEDGTLPVIKHTLFSKRKEPQLLDEFLNNLNVYGTRNDVAMLVQSNQSYFHEGPILSVKNCAKAVSVLVSNKTFMDLKQKSKKKLKTWQKYLPKKLSTRQKMKIKRKSRKTRVQSLLDDAENIISTEMGKRSIRLPARFLDSALVRAGSEWVSPLAALEDSPPTKRKRQMQEDRTKTNENDSSDSESSTTSSSSDSETSVSVENDVISIDNENISEQKDSVELNVKLLLNSEISEKRTVNPCPKSPVKRKKNLNLSQNCKRALIEVSSENKLEVSVENLEDNSSNLLNKESPVSVNKYNMQYSSCVHTSRTSIVDTKLKSLFCSFCINEKPLNSGTASNSSLSTKITEVNIFENKNKCISKNNLDCTGFKTNAEIVSKLIASNTNSAIRKSPNRYVDCDNTLLKASELPNSSLKLGSNKHVSSSCSTLQAVNLMSLNNSDTLSNDEKKVIPVDGNSTSVPPNNVNKNYILLLAPVKTVGNVNNTANTSKVPIFPKIGVDKTELMLGRVPKPSKVNLPQKCQPPILIRKPPGSVDAVNYMFDQKVSHPIFDHKISSSIQNTSSCVPFINLQDHCGTSAALRLSQMAESHALAVKTHASFPTNISDNKDKIQKNVPLINNTTSVTNNSLPSGSPTKVVSAYKVGDGVFLCNTIMPELKSPSAATKVMTSAVAKNECSQNTDGPIIASVQSNASINSEKESFSCLQNGLAKKVPFVNCDQNPSSSLSIHSDLLVPPVIGNEIDNHHNYSKKKPVRRRKSPLTKMNCDENEKVHLSSEEDVDIETVDTAWNALKEMRDCESDSDISDKECANIFSANADNLALMLSKKSIKERKRRLLIKSGFENLKASSKEFKTAQSSIEILQMAIQVIEAAAHKGKLLTLAKKRMQVHNTLLLEKLVKSLEGFESPDDRDKIKMKVIEDLGLGQKKHKKEKSIPLHFKNDTEDLSNVREYHSYCSAERNISTSDAPDIEMVGEQACAVEDKKLGISPKKQNDEQHKIEGSSKSKETKIIESPNDSSKLSEELINDNSRDLNKSIASVVLESSEDLSKSNEPIILDRSKDINQVENKTVVTSETPSKSRCHELRKLLAAPTLVDIPEIESGTPQALSDVKRSQTDILRLDKMKQKVKESLEGKNVNEDKSSNSDTESLDSSDGNHSSGKNILCESDDDIQILDSTNCNEPMNQVSRIKDFTKNCGKIEINLSDKTKTLQNEYPGIIPINHPKVLRENFRKKISFPALTLSSKESSQAMEENALDIDSDVAIIGSKIVNSSNANTQHVLNTTNGSSGDLSKAANKLFGSCSVQKAHLKNNHTVFAYKPDSSSSVNSDTPTSVMPFNMTPSITGVRNLNDVFSAIDTIKSGSNQNILSIPEEIVILDSDEDTQEQNTVSPSPSGDTEQNVLNIAHVSLSSKKVSNSGAPEQLRTDDSDSDDDRMHIDESITLEPENSSL